MLVSFTINWTLCTLIEWNSLDIITKRQLSSWVRLSDWIEKIKIYAPKPMKIRHSVNFSIVLGSELCFFFRVSRIYSINWWKIAMQSGQKFEKKISFCASSDRYGCLSFSSFVYLCVCMNFNRIPWIIRFLNLPRKTSIQ